MKIFFITLVFYSFHSLAQLSFIENLSLNNPLSLEDLQIELSDYAKKNKNFALSIGESHIDRELINTINGAILKSYFDNIKKSILCSESIPSFFESSTYLDYKKNWSKVIVYKDFGPAKTHLIGCEGKKNNTVLYSGFFHQQPFARLFPQEFKPTPVQSLPNKNFKDLLGKRAKFFVSHFDLVHLESTATKLILNQYTQGKINTEKFIERFQQLSSHLKKIRSEMIELDSVQKSRAIVIGYSDLSPLIKKMVDPNTYFLISDYSVTDQLETLSLRFSRGDFSSEFLKKLQISRPVYLRLLNSALLPNLSFTYGSFSQTIHPQSEMIIFSQEKLVLLIEPNQKEVNCYRDNQKIACPW